MQISVVLTIYNEREVIDSFIERTVNALQLAHLSYELIFVDDRSTDGTRERILFHQQSNHNIKYLGMSRRFGRQECFFAGFKEAKGDFVTILDCDLQDPPELIPQLYLTAIEQQAEVVYSVMKERPDETKLKLLLISWGYSILRSLCPIPIISNSGTFKLVSRKIVEQINGIDEFDTFFKTLITWIGYKQVPYLFERQGRPAGKSHYPMYGLRAYRDFLAQITSFSYRPLYGLALVATFFVIASAILFIASIVVVGPKIFFASILFSPLAVLNILLFSLLLFALALVAAYTLQIHASTKGRPRYIVEERLGF